MTKRRTQPDVGPRWGRGHYSEDGGSWWDDSSRRWFPLTDAQDTLEIELEDAGGTSPLASLLATLGSQFGNAYHRFVGRAHSPDSRWPTYAIVGKTFPAPRAFLADLPPQDQWAQGMTQALNELREELLSQGWRPVGKGTHPWSFTYVRPGLDLAGTTSKAKGGHEADGPPPLIPDHALHAEPPSHARTVRILGVGLLVWAAPVLVVALLTGTGSTLTTQGLFFSGTALVTFGGAYAVLAFVAQRAVETYGWLSSGEMVRGLALAETTPGPLIMVVQFVAFLGAYHHPNPLSPWTAALVGALLTTWVTFVPCFLFIFLGAPYVERLRGNHSLSAALTGITAAVVG